MKCIRGFASLKWFGSLFHNPGATSEHLLLEDLDNLIKYQPESVIIHAGTNDLTN